MATNLEQWNPNIKSPGQQSPGGAYRNPEAVIPDWKSITASWQKVQDSITSVHGGFIKYEEEKQKKLEEEQNKLEKDDKKRQKDNLSYQNRDLKIIVGIDAKNQEILINFVENKIKEYGDYADQTQKVQAEWMKEIKELGISRTALETLAKEWNKNNDIDYSKLNSNKEMVEFLNSMFTVKDSMKRIDYQDGVFGMYYTTDEGVENFMPFTHIQAAVTLYTDAGDAKADVMDKIEEDIGILKQRREDIALGKGAYKNLTIQQKKEQNQLLYANFKKNISDYSEREKQFISNNFFGEENRYIPFDPKTMGDDFDVRFERLITERFGSISPDYQGPYIPRAGWEKGTLNASQRQVRKNKETKQLELLNPEKQVAGTIVVGFGGINAKWFAADGDIPAGWMIIDSKTAKAYEGYAGKIYQSDDTQLYEILKTNF
jgi:hypothetical protein